MVQNFFTKKKSDELKNRKVVTPEIDLTGITPKSNNVTAYDTKDQILVAVDPKYNDWFNGKKLVGIQDLNNAITRLNATPLRQRTSDWIKRMKHYQTQLYLAQKTQEGQNKK